jgi:large subunit ribosomal protein L35
MKTRKTITKRIKVTGRGKLLRRVRGISHNMSKKSSSDLQKKKVYSTISKADLKRIKSHI